MSLYDQIGQSYSVTRRPDPRLAAAVVDTLGDARTVVNVGVGSYEPRGRVARRRVVLFNANPAESWDVA